MESNKLTLTENNKQNDTGNAKITGEGGVRRPRGSRKQCKKLRGPAESSPPLKLREVSDVVMPNLVEGHVQFCRHVQGEFADTLIVSIRDLFLEHAAQHGQL